MKSYKVSEELVDVLLKFGFKDETDRYYPEHFERLKNGYDPLHVKRRFSTGSYKDYVIFEFINIKISGDNDRYVLTENELKSLIVFHHLSSEDRRKWRESSYGTLEGWKIVADIEEYPTIYPRAFQKRIKTNFESLTSAFD